MDKRFIEPSPLLTLPKTYRVAYFIPSMDKWHWHDNCCIWQAWYLCATCYEMGRLVRILDKSTGTVYGTEIALLNLFSNRLSDRKPKRNRK